MRHNNEPEKPRVYIEYDTTESGGEVLDPNDRWSSHEPIHTTLHVLHLYKSKPDIMFTDSLEVEDEKVFGLQHVYLVTVRYTTGNTFGTCYGAHEFYSVRATEAETLADKLVIETPSEGYRFLTPFCHPIRYPRRWLHPMWCHIWSCMISLKTSPPVPIRVRGGPRVRRYDEVQLCGICGSTVSWGSSDD